MGLFIAMISKVGLVLSIVVYGLDWKELR